MKGSAQNHSAGERRQGIREFAVVVMAGLLVGSILGWWGERTIRTGSERARPLQREPIEVPEEAVENEADAEIRLWMEELAGMGRRVVPERTVTRLAVRPLEDSGRVSDSSRELFLLTDDEIDRVNRLLAEVEERLVLAEMMQVEVLELSDREAVFLIPVLEEGAEIEQTLRDGLLEILGETDGELFWSLLRRGKPDGGLDRWRSFGGRAREIVFGFSDDDPREVQGDPPDYEISGWLRYEERVAEDFAWLPEAGGVSGLEVKRVGPLPAEARSAAETEDVFFNPHRERYGFLVPLLPDTLRDYFH